MRRAAKIDGNHRDVVKALERLPAEVLSLAQLGKGVPDLLVLFRGRLSLLEVKMPGEKPNEGQLRFAERWPVSVVRSGSEAVLAVVEAARPGSER